MADLIGKITVGAIQGLLALAGFGALTYMFIRGKISPEVYVPLVSLMIGFFFRAPKGGQSGN